MYKMNTLNRAILVLLLSMPLAVFADTDSMVEDAKEVATDTGKAIKKTTKELVDETGKAMNKAAKKVERASKDAEEYVADSTITTKVKAKLAGESDIPSSKISVKTTDGVVSLEGNVDTRLQADKILELTQSVHGVKDVNDAKLTVTSSESFFADAGITAKSKGKIMQLTGDKKIAAGNDLHVETTNGVVHVFGTVGKNSDVKAVKEALNSIPGVKDVKTNIKVAP